MGKDSHKSETPGNAFARMNFLYQASHLVSKLPKSNPLSIYYNRLLKEISKKVVEKLHPDLKRTICSACNYPLVPGSQQINAKIKTHRKRKKKMRCDLTRKKVFKNVSEQLQVNKYSKNQVEARIKKPNKLWWTCCKCGFSKGYLQQPSYKLWIHEAGNNS